MTDLPALAHEEEPAKITIKISVTAIIAGPNFQPAQEVHRSGFTVCIGGVDDTMGGDGHGERLCAHRPAAAVDGLPS